MKKMTTLFKKTDDQSKVIDELREENRWVLENSTAYRKWDGTACAIINGKLYKRYDAKINKKTGKRKIPPANSIACQEPDEITGHQPYWTPVLDENKSDKRMLDAFNKIVDTKILSKYPSKYDGTYEFCGPKVNGNPEQLKEHVLIPHKEEKLDIVDYSFAGLKQYLTDINIEGIVFWNKNNDKKCKIRKTDFNIKR